MAKVSTTAKRSVVKRTAQEPDLGELLRKAKTEGLEQEIPSSQRILRIRSLEPGELLQDTRMPDILTPLVVKAVYSDLTDKDIEEFLGNNKGKREDALSLLDTMDYIAGKAVTDGTKISDLTLNEKRWVFRFTLGAAEMLVTFRYDPNAVVESVDEGKDLQQVT